MERNLEFGIKDIKQLSGTSTQDKNVILYTNDCPKCEMLTTLLNVLGIDYVKVRNIEKIKEKGFLSVPVLVAEGKIMDFVSALRWLRERKSKDENF